MTLEDSTGKTKFNILDIAYVLTLICVLFVGINNSIKVNNLQIQLAKERLEFRTAIEGNEEMANGIKQVNNQLKSNSKLDSMLRFQIKNLRNDTDSLKKRFR